MLFANETNIRSKEVHKAIWNGLRDFKYDHFELNVQKGYALIILVGDWPAGYTPKNELTKKIMSSINKWVDRDLVTDYGLYMELIHPKTYFDRKKQK